MFILLIKSLLLLSQFPSRKSIANAHLTKLTNVLKNNSNGKYGRDKAILFKDSAINSIGTGSDAISFELVQTIDIINYYSSKINELEDKIKEIVIDTDSVLLSVLGSLLL